MILWMWWNQVFYFYSSLLVLLIQVLKNNVESRWTFILKNSMYIMRKHLFSYYQQQLHRYYKPMSHHISNCSTVFYFLRVPVVRLKNCCSAATAVDTLKRRSHLSHWWGNVCSPHGLGSVAINVSNQSVWYLRFLISSLIYCNVPLHLCCSQN